VDAKQRKTKKWPNVYIQTDSEGGIHRRNTSVPVASLVLFHPPDLYRLKNHIPNVFIKSSSI
jgi:hypothetical protein